MDLLHKILLSSLLFFLPAVTVSADDTEAMEIVSKMSLEEKASCVVGLNRSLFPPTNNGFPGRTTPLSQYGIPSLILADGTAGVRLSRRGTERATAFPDNMALASSWDVKTALEVGTAVGLEAKGYNVNVMLAPGLNIIRNPLCGRNFEYYSEDPLISGKMAAAYVKGIQSNGVAACIKHFACNNQETNRCRNDVRVSEKALREIYLKGFEISTREADPWTVMTSYNQINGTPVQETASLITDILRKEWGFNGLVMTDWSMVPHNTAAQIHAGNDLFMPGDSSQINDIIRCVNDGSLDIADLDRACCKVITLGRKCAINSDVAEPDLDAGRAVARRAAIESAVLLENKGMLPLPAEGNKAAFFGVRSYNLVVTGSGAGYVACPEVSQIASAFKNSGTQVDQDLNDLYTKYIAFASADIKYNGKVKVHIGLPLLDELALSEQLIGQVAERNDYAVITIGRTAEEGKERKIDGDFNLTETERKLISGVCSAFHAHGKKVAVVLNIAGIIETQSWKHLPDAILNIWLPGEEGGNAVCAILKGEENPSGRLAVTFAKDYFDYPSAYDFPFNGPKEGRNYDYTDYSEGIFVGYRHFVTENVDASYPFGYGLSYTEFNCSKPEVKILKDSVSISFKITNTGKVAGKEAVGLYVAAPQGELEQPSRELKHFVKTKKLEPGESECFSIAISRFSLSAPGRYSLFIGSNVSYPMAVAYFTIK